MSPIVKIAVTLFIVLSHHIGILPPNAPPKNEQLVATGFFEKHNRLLALTTEVRAIIHSCNTKLIFIPKIPAPICLFLLFLIILLKMNGQGDSIVASLCPTPNGKNILAISAIEVVALTMMVMAVLTRIWSIRTLRRHFTFEVTILPDLRVVSSGPYAHVRHPGYTCTNSVILETLLVVSLNPTGYLKACGVTETSSILK
ncbi:hypothetical protein M422DRAFT_254440 [Sphaerobolus stellatus SS14]|uniref:Protein-S-isoprenylcysteine O-methyltransferase n=1 Tax=Sphaerobolus stellatus (strain SS14) TaxID=990650 RepID=A0A0C9VVP0_SPHS4|nr:hypothetical protein M422DRAFT_254440 [Sphaerobolus stellatus SS14]